MVQLIQLILKHLGKLALVEQLGVSVVEGGSQCQLLLDFSGGAILRLECLQGLFAALLDACQIIVKCDAIHDSSLERTSLLRFGYTVTIA